VVHLYNGSQGIATFDTTVKPALVAALKKDVPVLRSAKLVGDVDVDAFVDERYVKRVYGSGYAKARDAGPPTARGGEVWLKGEDTTSAFATPAEVLRFAAGHPGQVRAAYVPDAKTGTLWFADRAVWVSEGDELRPYVTGSAARADVAAHPGARIVPYATALGRARAS
jgi:NitT/TauT family transport system substrate-binding protein